MKLYHGTSQNALAGILINGIRPRGKRGKSNWKHSIESNAECVYLTEGYSIHFASNAASEAGSNGTAAIVEVDTDRLDFMDLLPDEDAIEQISRGKDDLPKHWDMKKRTRYYRVRMVDYAGKWPTSIKALGTACHRGVIPVSAITRVAKVDFKVNPALRWASDPTITLMNYAIMGGYYRQLTRRIFDDPIDVADLNFPDYAERLNALPRDGVTIDVLDQKELVS
jgi:hypothetical protein